MIAAADGEVTEVESNYKKGLITNEEKKMLTQNVWIKTTEEVAKMTWKMMDVANPVRMIVDSGGARATSEQIKQLSGMRGLSVDPTGKIVELPTKSNYRQGLSVFEYFTSARGARKGVADKALKTADAGYLTRRLVDVAHDVIIRMDDCHTTKGLDYDISKSNFNNAREKLLGRVALDEIREPKSRKVIVKAGVILIEENIQEILK